MALLSVIRRWAFRDKVSIRANSRRTGLARNTIRKYLRAETVEPKFKVPDRPSKLDPFADKLSRWLRVEAGKSRKQKRTIKMRWSPKVGQVLKLGSPFEKDGPDDGKTAMVWRRLQGESWWSSPQFDRTPGAPMRA